MLYIVYITLGFLHLRGGKKLHINKTVIIDMGGTIHSNFFVSQNQKELSTTEKYAYWKYLCLNSIRRIKYKFKPDEMVLACDNRSWRKDYYKFYKANRTTKRNKSNIDWEMFYVEVQKFMDELRETFVSMKVLEVKNAEADDIIGVLVNGLRSIRKEIVIISRDKDFKQLLGKNVFLYDPMNKKYLECKTPKEYLLKQILSGDRIDGVPNLRSDDDVFVDEKKRQLPFGAKTITKVLISGLDEYIKENGLEANYKRNEKMISLSPNIIPKEIQKAIFLTYKKTKAGKMSFMSLQKYLSKNKFRSLFEKIDHFL